MNRPDDDLLSDIADAIDAITAHLQHGPISVAIVIDAVAMRLLEIGEALKGLSQETTGAEPDVDWRSIAGMRDFLAHHYFATNPQVIQTTLDKDLPVLAIAVRRLLARLNATEDSATRGPSAAPDNA